MAKTILITGASSGIGRATALFFAERGWNVAATMRDPGSADATLDHPRVALLALDVCDVASIEAAVARTLALFGRIDVLLNNAGYALFGPLEASSSAKVEEQFATNVFGLLEVTRCVLPAMRSAGEGLILNVSSIVGRLALPYASSYVATKFAVEGLSESMRYELAPFRIRVKLIEPEALRRSSARAACRRRAATPTG